MISRIEGIQNGRVIVVYDLQLKAVSVNDQMTGDYMCFSEYSDMYDLYNEFCNNFSDDIDYKSALLFFNPNIEQ